MLEWLGVGGGVQGTYLSNVLVNALDARRERVRVLDPRPEPLPASRRASGSWWWAAVAPRRTRRCTQVAGRAGRVSSHERPCAAPSTTLNQAGWGRSFSRISSANRPARADELGLPSAPCGYPALAPTLEWSPGLFVCGQLAELELGPTARNIGGARLAAERLLQSRRAA